MTIIIFLIRLKNLITICVRVLSLIFTLQVRKYRLIRAIKIKKKKKTDVGKIKILVLNFRKKILYLNLCFINL